MKDDCDAVELTDGQQPKLWSAEKPGEEMLASLATTPV